MEESQFDSSIEVLLARNLIVKSQKSIVDQTGIGSSDIGLLECNSSRTCMTLPTDFIFIIQQNLNGQLKLDPDILQDDDSEQ
ncbi:Core-2/I-branching beta-1,6-N-acetylglucosaminyltransferase family protein [Prunus dulcis]|uniref:Core-2/I-branching beta-1,6-N-acetylglucosaminyltransferase family protein n=1 Tax=Prunus dulcis TaxID=3755 RepID=A0A4Y1QYL9_PRUDU|nr:Core-2/I-branching beta-1,6-N-acetylglucosaminyltransferase family protein [Prunus dulcis]